MKLVGKSTKNVAFSGALEGKAPSIEKEQPDRSSSQNNQRILTRSAETILAYAVLAKSIKIAA
jgi:hypothetical protein